MSKSFAALQNLFLSSFQFSQMVILMIVSQNFQTNRGGVSTKNLDEICYKKVPF